jgi:hypothetical protein
MASLLLMNQRRHAPQDPSFFWRFLAFCSFHVDASDSRPLGDPYLMKTEVAGSKSLHDTTEQVRSFT